MGIKKKIKRTRKVAEKVSTVKYWGKPVPMGPFSIPRNLYLAARAKHQVTKLTPSFIVCAALEGFVTADTGNVWLRKDFAPFLVKDGRSI